MLCDARNVYPNNVTIDTKDTNTFNFDFYGDYSIGADFKIYYADTMEVTHFGNNTKRVVRRPAGYYNGDNLKVDYDDGEYMENNQSYVWKARVYEPIDMINGQFPTTLVTSGTIQKAPYVKTTVQDPPNYTGTVSDDIIPIEKNLDITLPCYCYMEGYGYKNVVSYGDTTGALRLSSAFSAYPDKGTELIITKVKSVDLPSDKDKYLFIEVGNDNISADKFYTTSALTEELPCCYIKIGTAYRAITKYKKKTGTLYLQSAFASDLDTSVGTPYEIYCNYVDTPYFYVQTKPKPVITPKMEFANECIKCTTTLNKFYSIRYYQWNIYEGGVLIDTSEKIESGQLEYWFREMQSGKTYTGKLTIVTNDGVMITSDSVSCTIPSGISAIDNITYSFDETRNAIKLSWNIKAGYSPTSYMIMRQDKNDKSPQYLYTITSSASYFYDYKACSNQAYIYYITPKTNGACYKTEMAVGIGDFDMWSIYFLSETKYTKPSSTITDTKLFYTTMYGDKQYKVDKSYRVQLDIESGSITHNISREIVENYAKKPMAIVGDKDYVSFSLTFMFGNILCGTDDEISNYSQSDFEIWKDWVNTGKPVMIKDIKGNCWFGTITSHSFDIDYSVTKYMPYSVTIDFTETRNLDKTRIIN